MDTSYLAFLERRETSLIEDLIISATEDDADRLLDEIAEIQFLMYAEKARQ